MRRNVNVLGAAALALGLIWAGTTFAQTGHSRAHHLHHRLAQGYYALTPPELSGPALNWGTGYVQASQWCYGPDACVNPFSTY
jgi:hypothetical protein